VQIKTSEAQSVWDSIWGPKKMKIIDQKDLTSYFEFSQGQISDFLSTSSPLFFLAKQVDEFIRKTLSDSPYLDPTATFLLLNSYFLLMASFRTAATGHVAAIFPVARASLESSCYAFHICRDPQLAEVWLNREKGQEQRKRCRKAFTSAVADVVKQLKHEGHESLSEMVDVAYEATITYGAHPNSVSIFKHVAGRPDDGSDFWKFDLTCMYSHDSFESEHSMFACIEYGLVIAAMCIVIHKPHEKSEELFAEFTRLHDDKEKLIEILGWKVREH
jgi:hypothetical protein